MPLLSVLSCVWLQNLASLTTLWFYVSHTSRIGARRERDFGLGHEERERERERSRRESSRGRETERENNWWLGFPMRKVICLHPRSCKPVWSSGIFISSPIGSLTAPRIEELQRLTRSKGQLQPRGGTVSTLCHPLFSPLSALQSRPIPSYLMSLLCLICSLVFA